jgi:steroid delta-isomerase-like uncharacterized protein
LEHSRVPTVLVYLGTLTRILTTQQGGGVMSAEENKTIVQALFDGFNNRDLDRTVAMVTDDFQLVDIAVGQTFQGPEGFRQWLQAFLTAFPDTQAHPTTIIAEGDWLASEHTGRGTHTGPLVGPAGTIPPTGRSIEVQIAEIYQIRDGKVALLHAYYDAATILRQLGVIPAPGQAAVGEDQGVPT